MTTINGVLYRKGPEEENNTYYHFLGHTYTPLEAMNLGLEFVKRYDSLPVEKFDQVSREVDKYKGSQDKLLKKISFILSNRNV